MPALDLAGALPDALDAQLAVVALGGVAGLVAAPAEQLHGAVGHAPGHLGGEQLRHRDLAVHHARVLVAVQGRRGRVGQQAPP